jgi:hypothetical protein
MLTNQLTPTPTQTKLSPAAFSTWSPVKLWWPQGGGGMWLNYYIFASKMGRIIPGDHTEFNYVYLENIHNKYRCYVNFIRHLEPPSTASIVLGGSNAWFNYYLNLCIKKVIDKDLLQFYLTDGSNHNKYLYQAATLILDYVKRDIKFNLMWTDIFTNPEKFTNDLNQITGMKVRYNESARAAIEQYRKSCLFVDLDSEVFQKSSIFQSWQQALKNVLSVSENDAVQFTKSMYYHHS